MSNFTVPVVIIGEVRRHENADTLSVTMVFGENVIFKTGEFREGDAAIYVPIDAVLPLTVPGTDWLGQSTHSRRIKAKKLRGLYSEGLLLPIQTIEHFAGSFDVGDDVGPVLGIVKYEDAAPAMMGGGGPRIHGRNTEIRPAPPGVPTFDVDDQYLRNRGMMRPGDPVVITEKIHGTQVRIVTDGGRIHVGSHRVFWEDDRRLFFRLRNLWRRMTGRHPFAANLYWKVARQYHFERLGREEGLDRFVFYGEIYGDVQDLKYGHLPGRQSLRIFAIYCKDTRRLLPWRDVRWICDNVGLDTVPILYSGPFSETVAGALVECQSVLAPTQMSEGIVITNLEYPEVKLKWVSRQYKLRHDGTELH